MDQSTSYGRKVFAGVRQITLPRADWQVAVESPTVEGFQRLARQEPDAIIAHLDDHQLVEALQEWHAPLVNVSRAIVDLPWPSVGADDRAIGRCAGEFLRTSGYRRVGFIGRSVRTYSQDRLAGLNQGLGDDLEPLATYDWHADDAEADLADWIKRLGGPLALAVVGDEIAVRVASICRANGIGCPDPVAMISLTDDEQVTAMTTPTLTAVHLPQEQIGIHAAELVEQLLDGGVAPSEPILISPAHVNQRASTVTAAGDELVAAAVTWLDERLAEPVGVDQVADALGVGRRRLERRFSAVLGVGVYGHLISRRLDHARERLRTTDEQLETIAKACGFAGAQHLCDVFRTKLGETPGAYRDRTKHDTPI